MSGASRMIIIIVDVAPFNLYVQTTVFLCSIQSLSELMLLLK